MLTLGTLDILTQVMSMVQMSKSKPKSISHSTSCINGVCESITINGGDNESISSSVNMIQNNGTITTTRKTRLCKGCLCLICKATSCIIRRRRSRKCYRLIRRLIHKLLLWILLIFPRLVILKMNRYALEIRMSPPVNEKSNVQIYNCFEIDSV
uniref:Uncharacterized protein n=1 Tax=Romanomermis culicivorax TaxID=13658 RepID=A0A915KAD8_ROMCU